MYAPRGVPKRMACGRHGLAHLVAVVSACEQRASSANLVVKAASLCRTKGEIDGARNLII